MNLVARSISFPLTAFTSIPNDEQLLISDHLRVLYLALYVSKHGYFTYHTHTHTSIHLAEMIIPLLVPLNSIIMVQIFPQLFTLLIGVWLLSGYLDSGGSNLEKHTFCASYLRYSVCFRAKYFISLNGGNIFY